MFKVPMNSDFTIKFTGFRDSYGEDINLSTIDKYVLVISKDDPSNAYTIKKDSTIDTDEFFIYEDDREVVIQILHNELTSAATYYVNLYLYIDDSIITSLSKCFVLEQTVSL